MTVNLDTASAFNRCHIEDRKYRDGVFSGSEKDNNIKSCRRGVKQKRRKRKVITSTEKQ